MDVPRTDLLLNSDGEQAHPASVEAPSPSPLLRLVMWVQGVRLAAPIRIGLIGAAFVLGAALNRAFPRFAGDQPFSLFYISVLVAALVSDTGAVIAVIVGAGALSAYWIPPDNSFRVARPEDVLGLVTFSAVSLVLAVVIPNQRRMYARSRAALAERNAVAAREQLAAQELAAASATLRALYEAMPCGVLAVDEAGVPLAINSAALAILGLDRVDLAGPFPWAARFPVYRGDGSEIVAADRPSALAFRTGVPQRDVLAWLARSDGSRRLLQIDAVPMPDRAEAPRQAVMTFTDVTERKQAEMALHNMAEALRASDKRLRDAVSHAPLILFTINREGIFTLSDGGALASLGLVAEEAVGQSIFTRYAARPDLVDLARRALAGETFMVETELGGIVFETWWAPERDQAGEVIGATCVAVNVTDQARARRDAEQAQAAFAELARLRSDFVAAVSHELRTPLTAVIGYSELLQAHWQVMPETQRRERIDRIVAAANRQKHLVEDLLLLTQLEARAPTLSVAPLLVSALIERVVQESQGSYPGQQINLEGPEDLLILADAKRTTQILANLVDNAAKYSPEGSAIRVCWGIEEPMAVIQVIDAGTGVPEPGRAHLFTRFGRVPGSQIRAGHVGTGLGLYLGRQLARAMGGDLLLACTGPTGSTFELRLPLA